ncbi:tyrosine-type recombinase/integrase [Bradyrhizobium genosp. A]|uniref:tyrosine-type recombinase/integrase n=1 Tax=Bradyrhizobium genosp. A TaxID=83626 RepID=UPI003CFADAF0
MKVPDTYEWIVTSIGKTRPTEAGQVRLVIAWLVAFLVPLGLVLETADKATLDQFCGLASLQRSDVSMNRLVYTIRNVYAELHTKAWIKVNPADDLRWTFRAERRAAFDVDLVAVEELLDHIQSSQSKAASEEELRNMCCVQVAVDAGTSCGELAALNISHLDRRGAILIARGERRERIARLSPAAIKDLSRYLELRRDLFGFGAEALFVSSTGACDRLPLRSIACGIQIQIEDAGLQGRISPSDLGRYLAAKLISEGVPPHEAVLMLGYKRVPGVSRGNTETLPSSALKEFHPLHSENA